MTESACDDDDRWERIAATALRAEMRRRNVTAALLAERLSADGSAAVSAASVRNKLSRGTFGAGFFLRALVALECGPAEFGRLMAFSLGDDLPS